MKEASEEYIKKITKMGDDHFKKYGRRKMNLKEFNQLFKLDKI